MNAPFEHIKPQRVVALDGIYVLDQNTGHYELFDVFEEEPSYPYPGLIIIALCLIGWAAFGGMSYCLYRLVEVLAG
jgi:hypothetical protein